MKFLLVAVLCVAVPHAVFASDSGYNVTYDGGSVTETKAGTGLKLYIESNQVRFAKNNQDLVSIPTSAVTEISYGQDVHRRVGAAIGLAVVSFGIGALMALTKSKKHFIGITWVNGEKRVVWRSSATRTSIAGFSRGLKV
jgi:hypothetical protein